METFKVLQFNMQFGQRWDDADPDHAPVDLDMTIAAIRAQNADIVLLQEVEQARPGRDLPEPPPNYARLRAAFPEHDGYFACRKADPRELPFGLGLAILSKTPLRDQMQRDLPSPPIEFDFDGEKKTPTDRELIAATTTLRGHDLRIFNTHLLAFFMLNSSSEQHLQQRLMVLDEVCSYSGAAVLAGDFNVSKSDSLVQQFAAAGIQTAQNKEITWRRRPFVLDHIFFGSQLRKCSHAVLPTPASDHHLLVAEFAFAG